MYNVKTNVTVEKIDTLCTDQNYKTTENIPSEKKIPLKEKILSEKILSEKILSEKILSEPKQLSQDKNTIDRFNSNLNNIKTCLDSSELIVNNNSSESINDIDTDNLLKENESDVDTLIFKRTKFNTKNHYLKVAYYVKKNRTTITNTLYDLHIIKNKNIPFRILFHIFINYINQDIELIFD